MWLEKRETGAINFLFIKENFFSTAMQSFYPFSFPDAINAISYQFIRTYVCPYFKRRDVQSSNEPKLRYLVRACLSATCTYPSREETILWLLEQFGCIISGYIWSAYLFTIHWWTFSCREHLHGVIRQSFEITFGNFGTEWLFLYSLFLLSKKRIFDFYFIEVICHFFFSFFFSFFYLLIYSFYN